MSDLPPHDSPRSGSRGLRDVRRRPLGAPAPLAAPRIFVSSRRRRSPTVAVAVAVAALWIAALLAVATAVT
jgi:hypothetical protein